MLHGGRVLRSSRGFDETSIAFYRAVVPRMNFKPIDGVGCNRCRAAPTIGGAATTPKVVPP
ncbi:MAG TPA: hypothetical protein DEO92_07565 [Phycisphaerales bacterium]|nr:hypothetical protein [Phycisphaerales bacterium]